MSDQAPGTHDPDTAMVNAVEVASSEPSQITGLYARLDKLETWAWGKPTVNTYYCTFCGKSQHEVRKLVAGPKVFICNECVGLCSEICTVPA
jgi:hypothetical protein